MAINYHNHNISTSGSLTASSGNFTTVIVNGTSVSDFNSSVSGLLPTISNSGDNRVLTSTGSSVGINAESNLIFDGTALGIATSSPTLHSDGAKGIHIDGTTNTAEIVFTTNTASNGTSVSFDGNLRINNDEPSGNVTIATSGTTRFIIDSSGKVGIGVTPATAGSSALQVRGDLDIFGNGSDRSITYNVGLGDDGITGWYRGKIAFIPSSATNKVSTHIAFFNKDGDLGFSTLTERMRITSDGNVGIGTTSPNGKLDVVGGRTFLAANNEPYGLGVRYISTGGAVYFGATSSSATPDAVISNAGGTELIRFTTGGNVGIGITTPTLNTNGTIIHIHSSTASRASMIRFTNNESGSTATDGLMVGKWSDGTNYVYDYDNYDLVLGAHNGNKVRIHSVGTSFYQSANGTPALGSKNFYAATFENLSAGYGLAIGGVNAANGSTFLQVQNFSTADAYNLLLQPLGGNVGIGTTSPQTALQISKNADGALLILSGAQSANTQSILFRNPYHTNNSTAGTAFIGAQDTGSQGGTLIFATTSNSSGTSGIPSERMRITSAGNVGIGTATVSSGFKLDLRGRLLSYTTASDGLITVQGLQTESSGTGKSAIQIDVNGKGGFAWQNDASSGTRSLRLLENSGYGAGDTTVFSFIGGAFTFNRRLDITQGTTTGAQTHFYVRPENGGLGRDSQITFGCTFSNGWGGADYIARDAGAIRFGANGGSSDPRDFSMRFLVADGPAGSDTPRECMRISAAGNVGIGTTSPGSKLTVVGSGEVVNGFANGGTGTTNYGLLGQAVGLATNNTAVYVNSYNATNNYGIRIVNPAAGANNWAIYSDATAKSYFAGQIMIGTTANWGLLSMNHAGSTTFAGGFNNTDTGSAGQTTFNFLRNGTSVGSISTTNTATSYNINSDYRLKTSILPINNGLHRLLNLKPIYFQWIVGGDSEGFIAHELAEVVPSAVHGEKDAIDTNGNPIYQGVDLSKLVPLLVAALQETNQELQNIKNRLSILEGE